MGKYIFTFSFFIPFQAEASGQTGPVMFFIFLILFSIVVLCIVAIKYFLNSYQKHKRAGHTYAFIEAEGKRTEIDTAKINKELFDSWAKRMGYPKYKVVTNGENIEINSTFSPNKNQIFEIIRESV